MGAVLDTQTLRICRLHGPQSVIIEIRAAAQEYYPFRINQKGGIAFLEFQLKFIQGQLDNDNPENPLVLILDRTRGIKTALLRDNAHGEMATGFACYGLSKIWPEIIIVANKTIRRLSIRRGDSIASGVHKKCRRSPEP